MKASPEKLSKTIWVATAAIFVIAAISFAVAFFLDFNSAAKRQACYDLAEQWQAEGAREELTARTGECADTSQ